MHILDHLGIFDELQLLHFLVSSKNGIFKIDKRQAGDARAANRGSRDPAFEGYMRLIG